MGAGGVWASVSPASTEPSAEGRAAPSRTRFPQLLWSVPCPQIQLSPRPAAVRTQDTGCEGGSSPPTLAAGGGSQEAAAPHNGDLRARRKQPFLRGPRFQLPLHGGPARCAPLAFIPRKFRFPELLGDSRQVGFRTVSSPGGEFSDITSPFVTLPSLCFPASFRRVQAGVFLLGTLNGGDPPAAVSVGWPCVPACPHNDYACRSDPAWHMVPCVSDGQGFRLYRAHGLFPTSED